MENSKRFKLNKQDLLNLLKVAVYSGIAAGITVIIEALTQINRLFTYPRKCPV